MGAAAFVMAETLGVQYGEIIKAAVIPALIYYLGIIIQVQMRAVKDDLNGLPKDQMPKVGHVMRERGHLLIPIVFLLYMLIWSGKTVIASAFWTIIVTIVIAELRPISRMSLKDLCDAFAAAGLSGGNPMKTGWQSVRLALAGFIVPYMFVYNSSFCC